MNRNDLTLGDAIACTLLGAPMGIFTLLAYRDADGERAWEVG